MTPTPGSHVAHRTQAAAYRAIPVLLLIDAEPELFFIDRNQPLPWRGYERAVRWAGEQRERFARELGSPLRIGWGYRTDPQIELTYGAASWVFDHYRAEFEQLRADGDYFGVHMHPYRWAEAADRWCVDWADEAWVRSCITSSCAVLREVLGAPPAFFRFGERWLSAAMLDHVAAQGIRCDISLEPGLHSLPSFHPGELATGSIPDTRDAPYVPYRPSARDFRVADSTRRDGVWEIPITGGLLYPRFRRWRPPSPEVANMMFATKTIAKLCKQALARTPQYLALVVRTDCFVDEQSFGNLQSTMDYLLRHPLRDRFRFCAPEQALEWMGLTTSISAEK